MRRKPEKESDKRLVQGTRAVGSNFANVTPLKSIGEERTGTDLASVGEGRADLKRPERLERADRQERPERRVERVGRRPLVPASWRRKTGKAGTLVESFYHAFHGVFIGVSEQRNLRIHFSLAVVVTVAGFALKIDMISWMALVIVMALVIAAEFLNTALEHLVDISADGQYHEAARAAKDTAAAAVLAVSFAAVVVGCMVFLPKLHALFF